MVTITTLAIGAHGGFVLEPAARELRKEGHEITLFCEDSTNLDEELELIPGFLDKVRKSDLLFLNVHGDVTYFRHFDSLKSLMDSSDISVLLYGCEEGVVLSYRKYFRGSDEDYTKLLTLESIGGDDNHRAALLWALKHFDGADVEIPEPVLPLAQDDRLLYAVKQDACDKSAVGLVGL
jgi:cobaltochelatase CobN